jgi:ribonuclease R
MNSLEGIIKISTKGVGYVDPPGDKKTRGESIEIDTVDLNTALPSDLVLVSLYPQVPNKPRTGKVEKIIKRKRLEFVGVIEQENGFYFLVPDDRRVYKDILIDTKHLNDAKVGEKVLARITLWHDAKKEPVGEVLKVIGQPGEHETEMQAIVYEKGFTAGFPPEVEAEAEELKAGAVKDIAQEIPRRRDFRKIPTCTIDPADAKDFDDALSFQKLADNKIEVGVHIADVAHYVRPGTALDKEAARRGTSIYLVDRTIPMLPEVLSNDLCSLNEAEEKLVFSAVFTFDDKFNLVDEWFGRAIINSQKRFTYEQAQEVLTTGQGPMNDALLTINKLAKKLKADRMAAGAIAFEQDEVKFKLDEAKRPIGVYRKTRTDSHFMIEDLMLLANRRVAEFVSKKVNNAPKHFVYRVHDQPDADKLKQLANYIEPLGYTLDVNGDGVSSIDINNLLKNIAGKPEENMIQTAAMRSMSKAVYSMKNIGHYGLAFANYSHFTSPIRRYPDVMVHRLLDMYLRNEQPSNKLLEEYEGLSYYTSQMELNAAEAERDSIKYKQVEYLSTKIGQTFDGTISGLAKWGIYIQDQESLAEGMVRLMDMKDDFYILDEQNYAMVGQNSGRRWRLGDKVKVKLVRADVKERIIDFEFV